MAYQSLYRRYRPQKFGELRGQTHVVNALRNAVRDDRVGHAYLLSGPRGTGKTTAARILAKALNCENLVDGEPDGTCESCLSIEAGTSFDLHELDAASNNKVDDMRDLLKKVVLGSPGRTKVYLLDEVHMLSSGAENALLKTLEEPPGHVVFVLATTEPHKVVATIRSRTQHLELTLIAADEMTELVREIAVDADLDIDEEAIGHVVKVGGGSARDTLSALDQVVAAGGLNEPDNSVPELLEALASNDAAIALKAVESATGRGVSPRRIGEDFLDALRSVFLTKMGAPPARLSQPERTLSGEFIERMSPAKITRSLEIVGRSLIDMRQAPDPRIDLEVALVRACSAGSDSTAAGLAERVEALEAAIAQGTTATPPTKPTAEQPTTKSVATNTQPEARSRRPADAARAALKNRSTSRSATPQSHGRPEEGEPAAKADPSSAPPPPSRGSTSSTPKDRVAAAANTTSKPSGEDQPRTEAEPNAPQQPVTLEGLRAAWANILNGRSTKARARFLAGTVASVDGGEVTVSLSSDALLKRCQPFKAEVETAISELFGQPLTIVLAIEATADSSQRGTSTPEDPAGVQEDEGEIDIHDLTDDVGNNSAVDQITEAFPGAEVVDQAEG